MGSVQDCGNGTLPIIYTHYDCNMSKMAASSSILFYCWWFFFFTLRCFYTRFWLRFFRICALNYKIKIHLFSASKPSKRQRKKFNLNLLNLIVFIKKWYLYRLCGFVCVLFFPLVVYSNDKTTFWLEWKSFDGCLNSKIEFCRNKNSFSNGIKLIKMKYVINEIESRKKITPSNTITSKLSFIHKKVWFCKCIF